MVIIWFTPTQLPLTPAPINPSDSTESLSIQVNTLNLRKARPEKESHSIMRVPVEAFLSAAKELT